MKCRLCYSPLRGEIEYLIKKKVANRDIARKYCAAFEVTEHTMEIKIARHIKKKHPPLINMSPVTENKKRTFSEYAQDLLDVAIVDPMSVKHSHVIAAHNSLINEQKVKGTIDAQKMAFIRFMRGEGELIEGEVVDDLKLTGAENVPANTD